MRINPKQYNTQFSLLLTLWILCTNITGVPSSLADDFEAIEESGTTFSDDFIIDGDDSSTDFITLQFWKSLNKKLQFDLSNEIFELNDTLSIQGNLNFNQNQALNLTIENLASHPVSANIGQIYFNTTDNMPYIWNGTSWVEVTPGKVTLPGLQARRTSDFTLPASNTWYDLTFDTIDLENNTGEVEHDNTLSDNINIKNPGIYQIHYHVTSSDESSSHQLNTRVRLNDTSVINGSALSNHNSSGQYSPMSSSFIVQLDQGDFVTLQAERLTPDTIIQETLFSVLKLEGSQGSQGPQGPQGIQGVPGDPGPSTASDSYIIDSDNSGNPQILSFGSGLNKTLSFDVPNDWFNLSNRLNIGGDGSLSGIKLTTTASASDNNQNQIEVRNHSNTTVFAVDETGDINNSGTINWIDLSTVNTNVTNNTNNLNTHLGNTSNPHQVSLEQARLQNNHLNGDISSDGSITLSGTVDGVDVSNLNTTVSNHIGNTSNPHQTTLEQARSQNNQISGNLDFNQNQAENLVIDNAGSAPGSPIVGQIYYNTSDDISYYWNGTVWKRIGSTQFYETSDETESSTTSTTYQQKLRLSVSNVPAGKYRVGWYYEWQHTRDRDDFQGRIQLNDTTTLLEHRQESKDAWNDQYAPVGGFAYLDLTAGSHYIDIDYNSSVNGETSRIRKARLEFWKIDD